MAEERMTRALTREAFAREAMTHLDHLYRIAFHLVKEPAEAQDLVQEAYVRALGSSRQFAAGSNLKAWLTGILYNFFFDNYHQKRRWIAAEDSSWEKNELDDWAKVPTENPGPESYILRKELNTKFTDALKKIQEEFRLPITLVEMSDFSYAEAAEIQSCPIGTIRSRLFRGRRLLNNHLKVYVSSEEGGRAKK